ncbi:MAG: SusC/RagA family TonB-linked outer membrane protein [Candidatus Kapaibacterium sp.]|nr:MAG: SusC/RagA family TonB-linked outer membrane protein [Candidatus Kapabacteria bacterium]
MNYIETLLANASAPRVRSAKTVAAVALALVCSFLTVGEAFAQKSVSGTVTAADTKKPIAGAKITARSNSKVAGAFSKADGSYSISVPDGVSNLLVEYVGMKKQVVPISGDVVNIAMKEDVLKLEELVVTAVGITQEKKALSYATQDVQADVVQNSRQVNVVNALQGQIAGAQINSSAGTPGASTAIRLRGAASITGNNSPLFVIDGIPIDNSERQVGATQSVDQSNRAIDINPDDIASINILKGAAAVALYGLQAGAGAIIITTKKGKEGTFNVNYSFTKSFDEVNKLPEFQTAYVKGSNGAYSNPGNNTGTNGFSYGPRADTTFWDGRAYEWDGNGRLIGRTAAAGISTAKPFQAYDPRRDFFRTGETDLHTLNISGGTNLATYFFSLSNSSSSGVIPNSRFDKTTARANVEFKLAPDFRVNTNLQYIRSVGQRTERGNNIGGVMLSLLRTPISFDVGNRSNGVTDPVNDPRSYSFTDPASPLLGLQRGYRGLSGGSAIYDNPFWTVNRNLWNDKTDRVIGNMQFDYEPQNWFGQEALGTLGITWRAGGDIYGTNDNQNTAINSVNYPTGAVYERQLTNQIINSDFMVRLKKELGDVNVSLLLGNNIFQSYYRNFNSFATTLISDGFFNHANAIDPPIVNQTLEVIRRAAFYGNATIDYKGMFVLNGNIRNEWSTTLPAGNNSFLYGGVSASVIMSELLGLTDNEVLSFWKLRGSYALTGQDAPIYATQTPFNRAAVGDGWVAGGITFPINSRGGFLLSPTVGNPTLRPENRSEWEIGTEIKLFLNRLSFDVTYYNTRNQDLILTIPLSSTTGFFQRQLNAATMANNGLEVVLRSTPIQTDDFSVDFNVNFSTFRSIVERLAPGVPSYALPTGFGVAYAIEGQPYGVLNVGRWRRTNQGQLIINDNPNNGIPLGFPMVADTSSPIGANIPDFIAGINLGINFKGLRVSALLDIKQGGKMWNGTRAALNRFGTSKLSEQRGQPNQNIDGVIVTNNVFQGVKLSTVDASNNGGTPTDASNAVRGGVGQNFYSGYYNNFVQNVFAEPFVEDAGWVRLREVAVSYRFPSELMSATNFVKSFEIFAVGRNLWLSTAYTGVDPETSLSGGNGAQGLDYFNTVGTRTYSFGIRIGF